MILGPGHESRGLQFNLYNRFKSICFFNEMNAILLTESHFYLKFVKYFANIILEHK